MSYSCLRPRHSAQVLDAIHLCPESLPEHVWWVTQLSTLTCLMVGPFEMFRSHPQCCDLVCVLESLEVNLDFKVMKVDAPSLPLPTGPGGSWCGFAPSSFLQPVSQGWGDKGPGRLSAGGLEQAFRPRGSGGETGLVTWHREQ